LEASEENNRYKEGPKIATIMRLGEVAQNNSKKKEWRHF